MKRKCNTRAIIGVTRRWMQRPKYAQNDSLATDYELIRFYFVFSLLVYWFNIHAPAYNPQCTRY